MIMLQSLDKLYVLAELRYKDNFKDLKDEEIFPNDWYSSKNYKLKIEIILESLKENKLIKDTENYKKFQEHVE